MCCTLKVHSLFSYGLPRLFYIRLSAFLASELLCLAVEQAVVGGRDGNHKGGG